MGWRPSCASLSCEEACIHVSVALGAPGKQHGINVMACGVVVVDLDCHRSEFARWCSQLSGAGRPAFAFRATEEETASAIHTIECEMLCGAGIHYAESFTVQLLILLKMFFSSLSFPPSISHLISDHLGDFSVASSILQLATLKNPILFVRLIHVVVVAQKSASVAEKYCRRFTAREIPIACL